ncbi:hypothetical protein GCM10018773_12240 [Streptomyces candidus]|nr:hypothetical protein GCM10018773_12240 [Streptomyces candidus]
MQEAQFDAFCGLREDREVGAGAVVRGAQGISLSRPDLHAFDSSRSAVLPLVDAVASDLPPNRPSMRFRRPGVVNIIRPPPYRLRDRLHPLPHAEYPSLIVDVAAGADRKKQQKAVRG